MSVRKRALPGLLRTNPSFRRFWAGQTVSLVGDQVSFIALPLIAVLVLHASAAQMGYLAAAGLLPNLLFSLHAGALVDRRGRRRRTMIGADLGRAALLAAVPAGAALHVLSLPALCLVAFAVGTLGVLFTVSYSSLFVALVPPEEYVSANSLLSGSRALSFVVGPGLGGLLVQVLTAPLAVIADAGSFVVSALFLRSISPVEPPVEPARRGVVVDGVKYVARSAIIRSALGATATISFFSAGFLALFVIYATRTLAVQPATLGFVLGAGAVGGVAGSVLTGRLARRLGIGPAFLLGCVLFPAPLVLVPLAAGPRVVVLSMLFAAEFGSGLGVMILDISIGSILAALVPDTMRARLSGTYMVVNYGVRPLGALAAGGLASVIGLRQTLLVAAIGGLFGVLWLLPSPLPRLRALPMGEPGPRREAAELDAAGLGAAGLDADAA